MRRSCNYPSQTILDTLKFCNILDSNIMKEGIAVIKSAANKSCCNSLRNMLSKVEIFIKSDSQILRSGCWCDILIQDTYREKTIKFATLLWSTNDEKFSFVCV